MTNRAGIALFFSTWISVHVTLCLSRVCVCARARVKEREREGKRDRHWLNLIISTKADSHLCRCYSTTKTFKVKHSDQYSINNNHNKRQSDWNGNEKDSSEKQLEWKSQKLNKTNKQNFLGNLKREQGKGRNKIKLKKTTTKKRNRILNFKQYIK